MISSRLSALLVIALSSLVLTISPVMAQEEKFAIIDESLQDLNIVIGAGVAGAVLGLSTLSFVEKPADHLKNVIVGGALGVIIGVAVVSVGQASKSKTLYYDAALHPEFSTRDRLVWHEQNHLSHNNYAAPTLFFHQFSF